MEHSSGHFGEHVTIDGYGGDRGLLDSREAVFESLRQLPVMLGMQVLGGPEIYRAEPNGKKDPGGWTGFVIIAESHISIHTFPGTGFLSADVYTCQSGLDTERIITHFKETFRLGDVESHFIIRGTRYGSLVH